MSSRKQFRSDALRYAHDQLVGNDPQQIETFEQAFVDIEVAKRLYELRTKAGLSQRALAAKMGTTASVICRLEDADYGSHSLSMLRRIAAALDKRVELRFMPAKKRAANLDSAPAARAKSADRRHLARRKRRLPKASQTCRHESPENCREGGNLRLPSRTFCGRFAGLARSPHLPAPETR